MKLLQSLLIFVSSIVLFSCKDYNEPLFHNDNVIDITGRYSLMEGIRLPGIEISKPKEQLPNKIKKIIQYSGDTILGIIEYDINGNEIFNFSKSYIGEFWTGKYITTIKGKVFENNKLVKSYFFDSNYGFSLAKYEHGWVTTKIDIKEIRKLSCKF